MADLVRALRSTDGKRWFARLTGREARESLDDEIARWLSETGSAAQTLERLSAPGRIALALLVEAPVGLTSAELEFELGELGGRRLVDVALRDLSAAGLIFGIRARGASDASGIDPDTLLVLPGPLRGWLAPIALPLLLASAEAPQSTVGMDASPGPEDPGLSTAIVLAALRTVGARTTGGRLYKKDRQRLESLIGPQDADKMLRELSLEGLIRLPREPGAAVEVRWAEVERWARRPVAQRIAHELARCHAGTLDWRTLVDAEGAWVEEVHLARRSRLVTSMVYARPRPNPGRRREAWAGRRAEIQAWPEVEIGHHDGKRFFRLRPGLAAMLRAGPPSSPPPGKIFVQPDFEVLVPRDAGLGAALLLARMGQLARADVVATFTLAPDSIRQAVLDGVAPGQIVADLKALAAHGVPPAVERAIHDWAGNVGRCIVGEAVVVRFDDESMATRAAAALGKAAERVAPTVFVVTAGNVIEAEKLLEKAGFPPRPSGDDEAKEDDDDYLFDDDEEDDDGGPFDLSGGGAEHLAAILGLPGKGAPPAEIDRHMIEAVRAARVGLEGVEIGMGSTSGANPAEIGTSPGTGRKHPASTSASIAQTIQRAARAEADLVVVLRDGSEHIVRPLADLRVSSGGALRALDRATGAVRELPMEGIASALALYGTSRGVPRNQPCPCGSGRKFKRCCLSTDLGSRELGDA